MAEQFTPKQLDQLEDALERLATCGSEAPSILDDLELDAELSERLGEYDQVLALCREAFPLEEPREGLLDDVIAEAREVSRHIPVSQVEQRGGLRAAWERWRSKLIPALALAGTAAAVLVIVKPSERLSDEGEPLGQVDLPDREGGEEKRSEPSEPARAEDEPEPTPSDPPGQSATTIEEPEVDGGPSKPPTKVKPDRKRTASGAGAKPTVAPEPSPEPVQPLSKDDTWRTLERANAARRTGDCDRARELYEQIIAATSDNVALARAKGGVGLCLEQDRKGAEAQKWFDDAREASPGVDSWIRGQRDEQPLPGEKKAKTKMAEDPMDAADAL